jgi:transcriptional regulator with XRE-family HTH domain
VSVERVLDAYLAASGEPTRENMVEWIARYPQYERELVEFTVTWIRSTRLPAADLSEPDRGKRAQIAMEAARRVYAQSERGGMEQTAGRGPLISLLQEGKHLGFSAENLAGRLQLSVALLRKLENRLILLETIPLQLIEQVADALQRGIREISAYLALAPLMPSRVRLKARQRPAPPRQESFLDAVRADDTLDEGQRAYWLSFEENGE